MDHTSTLRLIAETRTDDTDKPALFGVTKLDGELFAPCYYSEKVKVFDASTLAYVRQWEITGVQCPGDIKTWTQREALFLIDWTEKGKLKQMYVVNKDGGIEEKWSMEDDFGRLDITKETTIVESFHDQNAVAEYTTNGEQRHKIFIPPDQNIQGLQHAIKLDNGQFLLSHGDPQDAIHRVCLVDGEGTLLKSFGGEKGSGMNQLNVPVYLEVDSQGLILVADKFNRRILLLNSNLEFEKVLIGKDVLRYPVKMFLEESKLYVVDNDRVNKKMKDGRILVFDYPSNTSAVQ